MIKKLCFLFIFLLLAAASVQKARAGGTITGVVFSDYNMNGARDTSGLSPNLAIDVGLGGVVVTAYDSGGAVRGTATTAGSGAYSLTATGSGPYRIEFSNLPAGYFPSAVGASGPTVRFVPDGNSTNVDLGVIEPKDYCQNIPMLVTNSYVVGNGPFASLVAYPYNYSDELDGNILGSWTALPSRNSLLAPTLIGDAMTMGATFGVAWNNLTNRVYAAAYLKRGARFGSLSGESTGAIYVVTNPTSTPSTGVHVDLNAVFGAGTAGANPHPSGSTSDWGDDSASIPLIGKRGLGGLKLSQDGTNLYAVNLADRRLYVIPTSGALNSSTIQRFDIPTSGLTTSSGNCATADVRPFAVGRDRSGNIYVGAVCSAESENSNAKLHAYVWRFDNPSFTLVTNRSLTFTRTAASGESATWQRWANTTGVLNRAAPMLTDIEFDGPQMILGFRDRYGDQVVFPDYYRGYGDILRACASGGGNFTFENNGSCGGVTAGGDGTGEGPGGGEYYADLNGDNREEGALGGLVQVPGYDHVITTFYDPVTYDSDGARVSNFYTAGIQRYHNATGQMTGAYDVYLDADPGNFGKADGVGDSEVLCAPAPLQIGNRVWNDIDRDGLQDANEPGIANVAVQLWADTNGDSVVDTQVGATTTDAGGNYLFGGVNNTSMSGSCPSPGSVDVRVNNSSDDAEQNLSTNAVSVTGSDLELTADGSTQQAVGVRFNYLDIPQGSVITGAYIEFTARSDQTAGAGSPTFTIRAENSDQAVAFTTAASNISSRPTTAQSVNWTPGNWTSGSAYQTPDLSGVVQAVVNRSGWMSGNSMVFVMSGAAANNYRRAWSFDGGGNNAAPRLVVQFTPPCRPSMNPGTRYEVRLPASNFSSGQPLFGRVLSPADADSTAGGDGRDSDGAMVGGMALTSLTTGGYGQNNHNFDFGFFIPVTAAPVSITGRVVSAFGRGISNVTVILTTAEGATRYARTNSFGYYRFDDMTAGQTVVVSVSSKRHQFAEPSRVVNVGEDVADLDFVAAN